MASEAYDLGDGMVMYIGPAADGTMLEVGVVAWHETLAIVHAMAARPRFMEGR